MGNTRQVAAQEDDTNVSLRQLLLALRILSIQRKAGLESDYLHKKTDLYQVFHFQ